MTSQSKSTRKVMMKIVHVVRTGIYIAGIVAVIILTTSKCIGSVESFWPPDMIPHPEMPSEPEQDKMV